MWKIPLVALVLFVGGVLLFRPSFLFPNKSSFIRETADDRGIDDALRFSKSKKPRSAPETSKSSETAVMPTSGAMIPLIENGVWRYRVRDSRAQDSKSDFLMRVVRLPKPKASGTMETGFEGALESNSITDLDDDIRIDGIGFVSPPDFKDNVPLRYEGETLPRAVRLIEGSVWEFRVVRETNYRFTNKKGAVQEAAVNAVETHRAAAEKMEKITVPKGRFDARRIAWISRVEMTANKRPVLCPLTTEPYRRETMWVAPGVGIVKRQIDFYLESGIDTVVLELTEGP